MVVIRVRPAWSVDLAGGDAHGPQGSDGERGFLTATPQRTDNGRQRRQCPCVGRLVGQLLVAPMIDLKDGILHAHALDPRLQLTVEDDS